MFEWDTRDSGMLLRATRTLEAGQRALRQRSGRPHTRRTGIDSPAQPASPRSRGKSRDTGMLKRDHRPFCGPANGGPLAQTGVHSLRRGPCASHPLANR